MKGATRFITRRAASLSLCSDAGVEGNEAEIYVTPCNRIIFALFV